MCDWSLGADKVMHSIFILENECDNFLVSKTLERRYYNIMLVEFLDGGM
jgi:hypothetical protein